MMQLFTRCASAARHVRGVDGVRPGGVGSDALRTVAVMLWIAVACFFWLPAAGRAQTGVASSSRPASDAFARARADMGRDDLAGARAEVQQGLKLDPLSVPGYNLLGIIETQDKNFNSASEAFEQALRLDPKSTETHNNLASSYFQQQKVDLARSEYLTALRIDPTNRDANYNLGLVLLAEGRPAEAITYFERVTPRDPASEMSLASAYLAAHKTSQGLALVRKLSAEDSGDVRVQFLLGTVLLEAHQYEAAEHQFEVADSLRPENYDILCKLGQAASELKHYAKSEGALGRAVELKPDSPEALYLLARDYADQRRDSDALQLLVRASKLAPENTDVIFLMARLAMLENYYEDAIPLLEEGVRLVPKRADFHAALGESYLAAGKTDQAIREFNTLIELAPSAGAYAFMGLCYRELGRFDEAAKYFTEGLKLDPRNGACLYNLGYIASRRGRAQEAETYLTRSLEANPNPNESDALLELGSLKMAGKKYQEALPLLQRAVKTASDPGPAYYKLARVEGALGMNAAADRDLKIFQTLSKGSTNVPYPFQHFFDAVNQRAELPAQARQKLDLEGILDAVQHHPDDPRNLYLLAETYLQLRRTDEALKTVRRLDELSGQDLRTELGIGVLLARFRLYPEAIEHFQAALTADQNSDEARYDLADAYFNAHDYANALRIMEQISSGAQNDDSYLALLGDVDAHLGRSDDAVKTLERAVAKNPDNDQYQLLLALALLRKGSPEQAERALRAALSRSPNSGRIYWGLGVVSVIQGNSAQAEQNLAKATELLPNWQTTWSTLGIFYFDTGQISKARETLQRSKELNPSGLAGASRIEQLLDRASTEPGIPVSPQPLSPESRIQFLQVALVLADQAV
ncbi:MAG TPA: tetratricopeptide repeat protein [Terriglobia bacterium]